MTTTAGGVVAQIEVAVRAAKRQSYIDGYMECERKWQGRGKLRPDELAHLMFLTDLHEVGETEMTDPEGL